MGDVEPDGVRLHVITLTDDKEHYLTHCNACGGLGAAWGEDAAVEACTQHLWDHGVEAIEQKRREQ